MKKQKKFYKVARVDGFDFYTGKTINYRQNIGKVVKCPDQTESKELCTSNVIHASEIFFDALSYGELLCSIFIVEGNPISEQNDKCGFKSFKVIKEIDTSNWFQAYCKYTEWMLRDVKNNFDNEKEKQVTNAINETIQVFVNARKTGKIDESTLQAVTWFVDQAVTWFVDQAVDQPTIQSVWFAAQSVWSAAQSVWSAAQYTRSAAWSAAWSAAQSVWSAAQYAALSAAWSAHTTRKKKYNQLSEKFIEFLENEKS